MFHQINNICFISQIFELLLSLCAVEGIRPIVCRCILSTCFVKQKEQYAELAQTPVTQIKEPLFAIIHWASQPAESHDQASLYAIDFLTEFYEVNKLCNYLQPVFEQENFSQTNILRICYCHDSCILSFIK